VAIAIGPEGGFSPAEAELARSFDYEYVSLGPNRLRTETAAIAAVHTIEQLNW
jgi:16S rRNA (uracil1498-N3)-methyltransferase